MGLLQVFLTTEPSRQLQTLGFKKKITPLGIGNVTQLVAEWLKCMKLSLGLIPSEVEARLGGTSPCNACT